MSVVTTITPAGAWELLLNNKCGRGLTYRNVADFALRMSQGKWLPDNECNCSPITFDADGGLIDGQHRLYAVILTRTPQAFTLRHLEEEEDEMPPVEWKVVDTDGNPVGTFTANMGEPPRPQSADDGGLPVLEVNGVMRRVTQMRPVHTVVVEVLTNG